MGIQNATNLICKLCKSMLFFFIKGSAENVKKAFCDAKLRTFRSPSIYYCKEEGSRIIINTNRVIIRKTQSD